jgi:hypothetical protein
LIGGNRFRHQKLLAIIYQDGHLPEPVILTGPQVTREYYQLRSLKN